MSKTRDRIGNNGPVQQVYMPNGKLVFQTTMPEMMYSEETARSMNSAGYTVKMNGKKWPGRRK